MRSLRFLASIASSALLVTACTAEKRPELVSSIPANGERGVLLLVGASLQFSEELDPQTVTSAHVRLRSGDPLGPDVVQVAVTYSQPTTTISVRPARALTPGTRYTIEVDGVADVYGKEARSTVTFTTREFPPVRSEHRSGSVTWEYEDHAYDEEGRLTGSVSYGAPGLDGLWYTPDDPISGYRTILRNGNGLPLGWSFHETAGIDGVWFTDDEPATLCMLDVRDADGRVVRRTPSEFGAGPDGLCLTSDDALTGYEGYLYSANGKEQRATTYGGRGVDGVWFSDDDTVLRYSDSTYDESGARVLAVTRRPGDGAVIAYTDYVRDAYGKVTGAPGYADPGGDGTWFTSDDGPGTASAARYWYDSHGLVTRFASLAGPGDDGIWFTSDDAVSRYVAFANDVAGNRKSETTYVGPGANGTWLTSDDEVGVFTTLDTER